MGTGWELMIGKGTYTKLTASAITKADRGCGKRSGILTLPLVPAANLNAPNKFHFPLVCCLFTFFFFLALWVKNDVQCPSTPPRWMQLKFLKPAGNWNIRNEHYIARSCTL